MSHSINVAITESKPELEKTLSDKNIPFMVNNGYIVIGAQKNIRKILSTHNQYTVFAYTGYFGGCGEQSARFIDLKSRKETRHKTINEALNKLNLSKPDDNKTDLFDWVGLGTIRNNSDLKFKIPLDKLQIIAAKNILKIRNLAYFNLTLLFKLSQFDLKDTKEDVVARLKPIQKITLKSIEELKRNDDIDESDLKEILFELQHFDFRLWKWAFSYTEWAIGFYLLNLNKIDQYIVKSNELDQQSIYYKTTLCKINGVVFHTFDDTESTLDFSRVS